MKEYTIDIHVKQLGRMLEKDEPCICCPAKEEPFLVGFGPFIADLWDDEDIVCDICRAFVGVKNCPCKALGPEEAISRSHKALKEYYETTR